MIEEVEEDRKFSPLCNNPSLPVWLLHKETANMCGGRPKTGFHRLISVACLLWYTIKKRKGLTIEQNNTYRIQKRTFNHKSNVTSCKWVTEMTVYFTNFAFKGYCKEKKKISEMTEICC